MWMDHEMDFELRDREREWANFTCAILDGKTGNNYIKVENIVYN